MACKTRAERVRTPLTLLLRLCLLNGARDGVTQTIGLWGGAAAGAPEQEHKRDAAAGLAAGATAAAWVAAAMAALMLARRSFAGRWARLAALVLAYAALALGLAATCVFNAWVRDAGLAFTSTTDAGDGGDTNSIVETATYGWAYWLFLAAWVVELLLAPLALPRADVPPDARQAAAARRAAALALSGSARRRKGYASKGPLKSWPDDEDYESNGGGVGDEGGSSSGGGQAAQTKVAARQRLDRSRSKGPLRWWQRSGVVETY